MQPQPKRTLITDHFRPARDYTSSFSDNKPSDRCPKLDSELQGQLGTVAWKARKAVSEGYKTNTSLPSYQGNTIGPTSLAYINFDEPPTKASSGPMLAGKSATIADTRGNKRSREEFDSDEIKLVGAENNRRILYVPAEPTISKSSSGNEDFEEASFLVDQE